MATEKISSRLVGMLNTQDEQNFRILLNAAQDDLAALRAAIVAITAKLDADATVTDTNYASTCNPAALTFTK